MILWTTQPKSVLDIIKSGKSFKCDGRKSECLRSYKLGLKYAPGGWDPTFYVPYKWMVQQMKNRGIQKDNRFPVWAWYRYHSSDKGRKAPRLRQLQHWKGEYRLKLSVPDELVLLSDYHDWHEPLNNMFCGSSNYIFRMMSIEKNKTWPQEKIDRLKKKSWEKIFNIDIDNQEKFPCIQACFPSIEPSYLLRVDKI